MQNGRGYPSHQNGTVAKAKPIEKTKVNEKNDPSE